MLAQITYQRGMMSAEEAFSIFLKTGLSRLGYEIIHHKSPSRFPLYGVIGAVEKCCTPPNVFIEENRIKNKRKIIGAFEKYS